jgi:hypothetical protein
MKQFYSYLWIEKDETPYYVGKGTGNRAFTRFGHRLTPPTDPARIFVFPQDSDAEAFESERALIALYGRIDLGTGCLQNLTEGGENPPRGGRRGKKHTLELRRHWSLTRKGKPGHPQSEYTKAALKQANLGRSLSVDHKRKLSEAKQNKKPAGMLGLHHSDESKQQMSKSHAGMKPPSREGCIPWNKGVKGGVWTAARRKAQEDRNAKLQRDPRC